MKRTLKSLGALLTAALLVNARAAAPDAPASSAAPAPTNKMADLFPDEVVAKGAGFEVKRSQLDSAMISIKSSAASRNQNLPPDQMTVLEQQVLQRLIQIQLLLARATEADKAAGKETCAQRLETIKTRAGSEENLNRQLKSVGTTPEELRTKLTEESTAELVLERELKVKVSEADIKQFYEDNPAKFEQPERVRVCHILLSTKDPADTSSDPTMRKDLPEAEKQAKRKKIDDLLKRARDGEDIHKLAREYSEDPGVKQNDGEYTFSKDDAFVPEFKATSFALRSNEVSEVVTTVYGYHIIKLLEKIPAKKVELAKVSSDIKDYLTSQALNKSQKEVHEFMTKLQKDANVAILDERLKPAPPDETALPAEHSSADPAKKPESKTP